ncbi:MAG: NAD-binding protein [Candidatus Aenigmarchaeota archaeon]|nr:NAD-binding protein [Candidatus Aenigmarchaeota archaeon]
MAKKEEVIWNRSLHLPRELKMLFLFILSIFFIGTAGFVVTKGVGFQEALLDTIYSMAFISVEIPNAGAQVVKTFIAFLGVIAFWWALWNIFDFVLQGRFSEYMREIGMNRRLGKLSRHYVICGAGRVGEHIAILMHKKGISHVLVDKNEKKVQFLQDSGLTAMCGDALDELVLLRAGIKDAKAVIAALPETEKNIMISLIAREAAPKIKIYARAEHKDLVKRLKKAGADVVVMPEVTGAEELFSHIIGRPRELSSVHV